MSSPPVPAGPDWLIDCGVPFGTLALANRYAAAAAALLACDGHPIAVDPVAVARHVYLPLVLALLAGSEPAAAPTAPMAVAHGAVCADLGGGDDAEVFDRLVRARPDIAGDPEALAAEAQTWRLPVTPYRRRPHGPSAVAPSAVSPSAVSPSAVSPSAVSPSAKMADLGGVRVVDLTTMWSGPLTTRLLADLGASVTRIEPDCRPDGMRSGNGAELFGVLAHSKVVVPLDLRHTRDRATFATMVAQADLVVDNLSPRARENLGLDGLGGSTPRLSLPAFGPGPMRTWTAYGTGVHAVSGLGYGADGPLPPQVTYPDPLTGLAGFIAALELLTTSGDSRRREVPMALAIEPLIPTSLIQPVEPLDPASLGRPVEPLIEALCAGLSFDDGTRCALGGVPWHRVARDNDG